MFAVALLDPCLWPEGSYALGSVLPSVCPPVHLSCCHPVHPFFLSFLGIGLLVFSETLYGVRGPYMKMCMTEPNFLLLKNPLPAKMTKNGQKMRFLDCIGKSIH